MTILATPLHRMTSAAGAASAGAEGGTRYATAESFTFVGGFMTASTSRLASVGRRTIDELT
jgi:hypothetical protein